MFELAQTDETRCAICTRVGLCINILNSNYFGKNGNDLFLYCTGLKLKTESFVICDDCESNLIRCYRFVTRCRELPSTIIDDSSPFTANVTMGEMLETEISKVVTMKRDDQMIEYNGVVSITINDLIKEEMETDDEELMTISADENDFESDDHITSLTHVDEATDDMVILNDIDDIEMNIKTVNLQQLHKCSKCGKKFKFILDLRQHFHMAHQSKDFMSCKICFKGFKTKKSLLKHRKVHRDRITKEYKCDICGLKLATLKKAACHVRRHMSEKPFKCNVCGKSFFLEESLKKHLLIHNGKKFQCSNCGKEFARMCDLRLHMASHMPERPFVCDLCGKSFKHELHLKKHKKRKTGTIHKNQTRYECKICGTFFFLEVRFKEHMFTLHEIKTPYECTICCKQFSDMRYLRYHNMKMHRPKLGHN